MLVKGNSVLRLNCSFSNFPASGIGTTCFISIRGDHLIGGEEFGFSSVTNISRKINL